MTTKKVNDPFHKKRVKIISAIKSIPKGFVASYGQVATIAGLPRGHRLVARVLGENDGSDELPWQRVIRADGKCGMPADSKFYIKQFALLKTEGVLAKNGTINMKRFQWQTDLDTLLFRPQDL